jgi:MoaA/NifB/PqqE/SkfB family radical SAM enzyme
MDAQGHNSMENQNQQPKPFCVAPFINFYYKGSKTRSTLRPCCESRTGDNSLEKMSFTEFWHSDFMKEVRQTMLDGQAHSICDRCIEVENAGGLNSRKFYDGLLKKFLDVHGSIEYKVDTGNQFDAPGSIDYRGSNLCNLKCRMCHVSSSSELAKEILEHEELYKTVGVHTNKDYLYIENKDLNTFINGIPFDHAVRVKFLGGEPLIQEDVYQGLEKLVETSENLDKVEISFTTNATNFPRRFTDLIGKFRKILMRISLDGVEGSYEYVRTNGNWNQISKNFNKLYEQNYSRDRLSMGFSFIVQAYSIFDMPKILEFLMAMKDKKYSVWSEPFFSPIEQDWLSTAILDQADLDDVLDKLDKFKLKYPDQSYSDDVKSIITNFDKKRKIDLEKARLQFKEYTNVQDKVRGTNLADLDERFKKYL